MNRRGFFSRLAGLFAGAAAAKALPASAEPKRATFNGVPLRVDSEMGAGDAAHPLYFVAVAGDFSIATPDGKRIALGAAPSRDVYGVGPGEKALRDVAELMQRAATMPTRNWFSLDA